jgi:uracil-DNA glycosylase
VQQETNSTTLQPNRSYSHEADLFTHTTGPHNARCILIGECWGAEEASAQLPFIGSAGKELDRILQDAGLRRSDILCTNVIHARPPGNDFTHFLHPQAEKGIADVHGLKARPQLQRGLEHLLLLIQTVKPQLLIAAGNIPLWALSDHASVSTSAGYKLPGGITSWRGSQTLSRPIGGCRYPLLPIIHPAAILREYGFRQITVQDLRRAQRFLAGGSWEAPERGFIHRPTWEQVEHKLHLWTQQASAGSLELAVDLETFRRKLISVVGISDATTSLCIPLIFKGKETIESYFPLKKEQILWEGLKALLEHPNVKIIGQNFIYDTEWFHRIYNIRAVVSFDTMVAHHLLFPGTPKRLDYLASLYCNHYIYWKDESGDWDQFPDDADRYWLYNCKDTRATFECAQQLKAAIAASGMQQLYNFQMANWLVSRRLTLRGVRFDLELQRQLRLTLMEDASSVGHWLLNAVPETLQYTSTGKPWFDSPKGTARLFYEVLGLEPVLHRKTKKPTTDDAALAELSERPSSHWLEPLFTRLRHLRSVGVFTSNFLEAKPSADGRMRSSFNIAHPETFRMSSNSNGFGEGLNGQNIPKGEE